jgi:hypothetical protein
MSRGRLHAEWPAAVRPLAGGAEAKEDAVALDPLDHRLLQGLAGIASKRREDELQVWLRRYLDEEISLA